MRCMDRTHAQPRKESTSTPSQKDFQRWMGRAVIFRGRTSNFERSTSNNERNSPKEIPRHRHLQRFSKSETLVVTSARTTGVAEPTYFTPRTCQSRFLR